MNVAWSLVLAALCAPGDAASVPGGASSQRYRRLMRRAFEEIDRCLDAGESFDITVDDGGEITGYRKVVRLAAD